MKIIFSPELDSDTSACNEYEEIWEKQGSKIVQALQNMTGLPGPEKVSVIVYEGMSSSGSENLPMKLRSSYSSEIKLGTFIHELGHRFIELLKNRPVDLDEHRILFLFLYDVWTELYGEEFALRMVETEKLRKGKYDYESAWEWALRLSLDERKNKYKEIFSMNYFSV